MILETKIFIVWPLKLKLILKVIISHSLKLKPKILAVILLILVLDVNTWIIVYDPK